MADIPESPVTPIGAGRHDERRKRREAPPTPGAHPSPKASEEVADPTSVMGIPPAELTPKVQEAIGKLLREFDRQREELGQHRAHESFLEAEAERHAYLPVPNRRAFHHHLSRVLTHSRQGETTSTLVVMVLRNFDALRWTHGRRAAEAALGHVAAYLRREIRDSDVVGSLGGNDLGLILTLSGGAEAGEKLAALVAGLSGAPFRWEGAVLPLDLAAGARTFGAADGIDAILEDADRALRGLEPALKAPGGEGAEPA